MAVSRLLGTPVGAPLLGGPGESWRAADAKAAAKRNMNKIKKCLARGRAREAPKKFSFGKAGVSHQDLIPDCFVYASILRIVAPV